MTTGPDADVAFLGARLVGRHVHVDGASIRLSALEAMLLRRLVTAAPRVVTRAELLGELWTSRTDPHVLEVTIGRLRKRLGPLGKAIETVPRRGYVVKS